MIFHGLAQMVNLYNKYVHVDTLSIDTMVVDTMAVKAIVDTISSNVDVIEEAVDTTKI